MVDDEVKANMDMDGGVVAAQIRVGREKMRAGRVWPPSFGFNSWGLAPYCTA